MTASRALERAIALRGMLMALLPPEVRVPMRAVYRMGLETTEEGLAQTDGRVIRIHPERFPALPPSQALYVLAHEVLHAALDHPGRMGKLLAWAEERVREAAVRARAGIPPEGIPAEDFPGWRAAWEEALGGDWSAWEARIREVLPDLVNVVADLLVNAWADLLADLVRSAHGEGLLEALPGIVRLTDPEARRRLLGASLEDLFEEAFRSLLAARPGSGEGEGASPSLAGLLPALSQLPLRGPLPLPAVGIGPDLRPPEGNAEGNEQGETAPAPDPLLREGLRRILEAARRRGLAPGDLVERIFPRQEVRLPWRQVLRAWLRQAVPDRETDWTRRDPRVKVPGAWVPRVGDLPEGRGASLLMVARDVSGSMDPQTLERVSGEIQDLAREIPGLQALLVLDVDAGLQGLVLVPLGTGELPGIPVGPGLRTARSLAEALGEVRGRGGTAFHPVFRALWGKDSSPMGQALARVARSGRVAGMIFFTDGAAHFPPSSLRPAFPVLWVVPRRVAVPFGGILEVPDLFPGVSR